MRDAAWMTARYAAATAVVLIATVTLSGPAARAQQLDMSHGGPIDITAHDGIDWRQAEREVIARGDAVAVRGTVTVTGDRLIAWYRKKAAPGVAPSAPEPPPAGGVTSDTTTEGNEIYRLQAEGHVRIFTKTDEAVGDKATYDLDQAVMVMTGRHLKLTTPNDVLTARDDLEYWPQKHMAVARGNAVVVTKDAKRVTADTLVAFTQDTAAPATQNPQTAHTTQAPRATQAALKPDDDPLASSGKLERVEAFGHVVIRTVTDTVTGERGVYLPDTGMARIIGNVQITRGQNQLNGAEADVNMKTGVATLVASKAGQVHGLVLPNDQSSKSLANEPPTAPSPGTLSPGTPSTAAKPSSPATEKKP